MGPPGWEGAAFFQPALQVSGDFYDLFPLADGRRLACRLGQLVEQGPQQPARTRRPTAAPHLQGGTVRALAVTT